MFFLPGHQRKHSNPGTIKYFLRRDASVGAHLLHVRTRILHIAAYYLSNVIFVKHDLDVITFDVLRDA